MWNKIRKYKINIFRVFICKFVGELKEEFKIEDKIFSTVSSLSLLYRNFL